MKKIFTWFLLLLKRQMKKPSLYLILLCMAGITAFIVYGASHFELDFTVGVMERQAESKVLERLCDHEGLVRFVAYDDEKKMREDVQASRIYAGYVFEEDFDEKLRIGELEETVTVISTPKSIIPMLTNEMVFSYVLQEYAYEHLLQDCYETGYFEGKEEEAEESLEEYYQKYLTNGSTFSAVYKGGVIDRSGTKTIYDYLSPMIDGMVAVFIFLSGLCGVILFRRDRDSGAFSRFTGVQTVAAGVVEVFIPVFVTAMMGMGCLICSGRYMGNGQEWLHMAGYILLVVVSCMVFHYIIPNRAMFAAMIPVFFLASLMFCHVFINLNTLFPQLKYISMLLPPYYF